MRIGVKSHLLCDHVYCLESGLLENNSAPVADATILDGETEVQ